MTKQLVLSLIGRDRPGVVDLIAARIQDSGGNWLDSRMSKLAGKFAGAVLISVPDSKAEGLTAALEGLADEGFKVMLETARPTPDEDGSRMIEVEVVGQDRPGIVHEMSHTLAKRKVNIEDLATDSVSGAMSGGNLFKAHATLHAPAGVTLEQIREDLEGLADELMVEVHSGEG